MRIITGSAKGARLETLPGENTRPTAERVKEAVFSSLHFELSEKRFLDLFAGSGQMGLEALSRGAASAVFVDRERAACDIIIKNARHTKLFDRCRVAMCTYEEYLRGAAKKERFDFIYMDPPFAKKLTAAVIERVMRAGILKSGGLLICEDEQPLPLGEEQLCALGLTLEKASHYGRMYLSYLRAREAEQA